MKSQRRGEGETVCGPLPGHGLRKTQDFIHVVHFNVFFSDEKYLNKILKMQEQKKI